VIRSALHSVAAYWIDRTNYRRRRLHALREFTPKELELARTTVEAESLSVQVTS